MDKIKSFEEFVLNEEGSALKFLGGILNGSIRHLQQTWRTGC
jgi:hypothetical protein